ncbi:hypothetical protein [Archangium sp.]|uniref:hypothetical protein n=1 Tax=Archangium sp. TaxID=1872627 RepID=UPI002D711F55|nr:hypothetical protein [Archangium sp.]HYO53709.1 hypothetical protein [Archangium sp.]
MSANDTGSRQPAGRLDEALADFTATLQAVLRRTDDLPEVLVHRAAADPLFLNALIAHRDDPAALTALLEQTPRSLPKWAGPPSAVLMLRAAKALVRWGRAGFREVDAETFEQRRDACQRCPHLGSPGRQLAYKLTADRDKSLCGLCGCAIERKARLPTEECPVADPTRPGMTRWGEPIS